MIKGTFRIGGDIIEIIVGGNNIIINDVGSRTITTIDGIRIDKTGSFKEFPDLKGNQNWRKETIKRLKEHINKMKTENEKMEYIKEELEKFGYEPLIKQRAGFRPQKF